MSRRHLSPWQSVRKESNLCVRSQSTTPSIPAESKKGYFKFDIHNAPGVKINQKPEPVFCQHELTTSFVQARPVEAVADVTSTQIAQLLAAADVREQRLQKAMSVIKSERFGHASRLSQLTTQFGTETSDIREALSSAQGQLSEYHISESSVRHLKEEHRLLELRVGELSKKEFDITARIAASTEEAFNPTTHVGSTLSPGRGFSVIGARVPPNDDTKIRDFGAGRRVINTHFGQEHSFSIGSFPIGETDLPNNASEAYGVALVADLKFKYVSVGNTRDIISAKGITV